MKLAAQVMMLAATAGLAVIALTTTRKPAEDDSRESEAHRPAHAAVDSDAWFV